ncbi:hypothetical protein D187_001741 [Cystobacter fuscus DSM 2262]|uniref:DNA 3'-5' helicase II n=1 Tax=Cystobacter fuscus (strain ATCC 25194 / DSM 2262 / NBRC 100088 / M29) TaxID=1242864 RepID=S9PE30_CYSF2|nr:UvrD family DEAD/DEAH box helicase [Cystobacter fuscus]EPX60587.1 hypothetical protein D187_001741 [Cystobacter fuscus DSM 2262]
MSEVEVIVYRGGAVVDRVSRPLRKLDGKPAVTYRKQLHTLVGGNSIFLDGLSEVEVVVHQGGAVVDRVSRPLRELDGKPAVTYQRRLHALVEGNSIFLEAPAETIGAQEEVGPPRKKGWDPLQEEVIEASPEARLLVDAGPGTGKTAVACARVAQLIERHDIQPTRIWLVSFTRTAVREVRNRIATVLGDQEAAYAVRIATLDSHAWAIHSGFDETAKIAGSHEQNIDEVLQLIREDDQVADYLDRVEHLIVDEAQDVVGIRADLVTALISKLSRSCGVTVFADEAQAIYGFANDTEARACKVRQSALTERLRKGDYGFSEKSLREVFRTDSPSLLSLFTTTRAKVLAPSENAVGKLEELRQELEGLADGTVPRIEEQELEKEEDLFVLFRRRAEALLASSFLSSKGVRHRLRMSGLPVCILPWVGACLGEHTAPVLTRTEFLVLWKERVAGTRCEALSDDEAWALLVRHAGSTETVVQMRRLRAVLGRTQPPADFCTSELGTRGPIVGTIHASKGREAGTVHLMMPAMPGDDMDCDEETRVVFVGATRAKAKLKVGQGYNHHFATSLESGRAYVLHCKQGKAKAQVEIGRDGDVSVEGAAATSLYANAAEVRAVQERLLQKVDAPSTAWARHNPDAHFTYMLRTVDGAELLGALTERVNSDLFKVAAAARAKVKGGNRRPPDELWHLHVVGVRTAVLAPDSPEAERLHAPWSASGIVLVPIVLGYTTLTFPYYQR